MKKRITCYLDNSKLIFFLWICLAILILVITKSMAAASGTILLSILVFLLFDYLEDSSFLTEEDNPDSEYCRVCFGDTTLKIPKKLVKK